MLLRVWATDKLRYDKGKKKLNKSYETDKIQNSIENNYYYTKCL